MLQRKYVREAPGCKAKIHGFHDKARKWTIEEFGPEPVSISEEEWVTILEEDKQHPYAQFPTSFPAYPEVLDQDTGSQYNEYAEQNLLPYSIVSNEETVQNE